MLPLLSSGWKTAVLVWSAAAVSAACAQTPQEDIRALTLRVGEQTVLLLPGNPTTGYMWSLAEPAPDDAPVTVELALQEPGAPSGNRPLCGAPQATRATLTGIRPGVISLVLRYARPWEKDRPAAKTQTLEVTVK